MSAYSAERRRTSPSFASSSRRAPDAALTDDIGELVRAKRRLSNALAAAVSERNAARQTAESRVRFLATVSHDLQQMLWAIRLNAESLEQCPSPAEAETIARRLGQTIDAAEEMLSSLLAASVLDSGMPQPKMESVELGQLLGLVFDVFVAAARRQACELRLVPSSYRVRTDPKLLCRALSNLVSNAIRYTDEGRILLGCRRVGSNVRVEVWDTGVGIAPEQAGKIFEDFIQLGPSRRTGVQGYGLGLSIVRRISALLGHRVGLRSQPGKGSVFSIEIPLATP